MLANESVNHYGTLAAVRKITAAPVHRRQCHLNRWYAEAYIILTIELRVVSVTWDTGTSKESSNWACLDIEGGSIKASLIELLGLARPTKEKTSGYALSVAVQQVGGAHVVTDRDDAQLSLRLLETVAVLGELVDHRF